MGVLGHRDDAGDVVAKVAQGGYRAQPQRARAYDHRRQFFSAAPRPGAGAVEGGVDGAGHGLDEHGGLVGQALRHVMELALMGGEGEGPAPTGVVAVPRLQAGRQVAARQVDAMAPPAGATGRAHRDYAPGLAAEHRFYDRPAAVLGVGHNFVTGYEGEADDGFEPP